MIKHKKVYTEYFGYNESSYIPCEIPLCGSRCVDVHHIIPRGMGGSKTKDYIENLMGVCREHHRKCESGEISRAEQMIIHNKFMQNYGAAR